MEKENVKKRVNVSDILDQIGQEANKLRKVSKTASFYAKQAAKQGANVDDITMSAAKEIKDKLLNDENFGSIFKTVASKNSLEFLLQGLSQFELEENAGTLGSVSENAKVEEGEGSPSTSRTNFPQPAELREVHVPSLPSMPVLDYDETSDRNIDNTSDSDSEFCPDWSSIGSLASTVSNFDEADVSDDDIVASMSQPYDVRLPDDHFIFEDDVLRLSDDEDDDTGFDSGFSHLRDYDVIKKVLAAKLRPLEDGVILPAPAAGNEQDEPMRTQTANSDRVNVDVGNKFRPQAIRRVKSMIYEVAKDNEIDAEQRKRMLIRKHAQETTPSVASISPSPLLSAEESGSLKRSPSQLSAKYSLKRSRSNLSMLANRTARHIRQGSDVIHEESDEDSDDVPIDSDSEALRM